MDNLGWFYYKRLYMLDNLTKDEKGYDIKPSSIDDFFKKRVDLKTINEHLKKLELLSTHGFRLEVAYPGLMAGIGYFHGLPDSDNDIKVGFFFDYTFGLPVIPSSSIKGILRSFFPDSSKDPFRKEKIQFIQSILGNKEIDVEALRDEIFEGLNKDRKPMPIAKRDKFLDAVIASSKDGVVLVEDYITPHEEFKDPTPIRFIKVKPGVEFEFNFILHDGIITADEKERLFFELICIGGVGAKTNSGYGHFIQVDLNKAKSKRLENIKRIEEEYKKQKETQRKVEEEKKKQEYLKNLSKEERLFEEYKNNTPELINKMMREEIDKNQYNYKKLAELIDKVLEKEKKSKKKVKEKAKRRKEFIKSLLNDPN